MTPFDVVKVRMQGKPTLTNYNSFVYFDGFFDHLKPVRSHGTLKGLRSIVQNEGILALWKGMLPSVLMSLPATVIYFVGYDQLKNKADKYVNEDMRMYVPIFVGGIARTGAAIIISPLELYRTRLQAGTETHLQVCRDISTMVKIHGLKALWRGLYPTLWRDVPFSAMYWFNYEVLKTNLHHYFNPFVTSFISGSVSGMIAAALTTPFDVAKTRRQTGNSNISHTVMRQIQSIYREEGLRGTFRGLSARIAKVSPACGIMISSYELGKHFFEK